MSWLFGVSYYPEELDAAAVERDARRMRDAGLNVVRMGEFAWARMEPDPGRFDFAWLDETVSVMGRHGIRTILSTPTAAPPKWLMDLHPEIYPVDARGERRTFGRRRHYCVNSPVYHRYATRIAEALAEAFRGREEIAGFQIDNELMAEGPHCYCPVCAEAFREWLRAKFGDIAALNRRWWTTFWSQTYRDFGEVDLPREGGNPSALLDYRRFFSGAFVRFAAMQAEVLRRVTPGVPVTHNICSGGFLYWLDLYALARELDIASVDNYPLSFTFEGEYGNAGDFERHPAMASFALSIVRGLKGGPFWVTESQVGRTLRPRALAEPGMIRAWTRQQIAHGARATVYFHWRQFRGGCEQLMHAVLDADDVPRRRYREVRDAVAGARAVEGELGEACPRADVALLRDFDCDWALADGGPHPGFRYLRHLYLYYRALFENRINAEVVSPDGSLAGYKLVVAPSLLLVDAARAARLRAHVEGGGTLVLTVQSGLRDPDNLIHTDPAPGPLREWCGIEIEEQLALKFSDVTPIAAEGCARATYSASLVFDLFQAPGAEVIARYAERWFAGNPAVVGRQVGAGRLYYVGCVPEADFVAEFLGRIARASGVEPVIAGATSGHVEAVRAFGGGSEFLHLVNFTGEPQRVGLAGRYVRVPGGEPAGAEVELSPLGAEVLRRVGGA